MSQVDWRSLRGLQRLHWGQHWVTKRNGFNCQVYRSRDNVIVARFWRGGSEAENECHECRGLSEAQINSIAWDDYDQWPRPLRKEWDAWFDYEAGYV